MAWASRFLYLFLFRIYALASAYSRIATSFVCSQPGGPGVCECDQMMMPGLVWDKASAAFAWLSKDLSQWRSRSVWGSHLQRFD